MRRKKSETNRRRDEETKCCGEPVSSALVARSRTGGFTIVEIIVVIVIIGVIAAMIGPRLFSRIGMSKQAVAESNAASLAMLVKLFMVDHDGVDSGATIDILFTRPSDVEESAWDPYVDSEDDLIDPWGSKFVLIVPGEKNIDFDIVSYGKGGKPGGEGEEEDIIKP